MTMSKVKVNKTGSAAAIAQSQQSVRPQTNKSKFKEKKKYWNKRQPGKSKPSTVKQEKNTFLQPPTDAQQFSANWKTLLEVLKANPKGERLPDKPQSSGQQKHNSSKVDTNKKTAKYIVGNNSKTLQINPDKLKKDKTAPHEPVPKSSKLTTKGPIASEVAHNSKLPTKRKNQDIGKGKDAKPNKKKKVEVERKPTEADLWFDDVDADDIEATLGPEAADIMRKKLGIKDAAQTTESALVKERAFEGLTRAIAMDCEMVGVGPDGEDSIVARVSLVNQFGKCVYDKFVKPTEKVTDYRTAVSGVRPQDLVDGEDVQTVQRAVAEILQGRILVGHAIQNDLKILLLGHPKKKIRDTQKYKPFKKAVKSGRPSLKVLCKEILGVKVQQGEHSSVQDAQATMRLYTLVKKQWEAEIKASRGSKESIKRNARKPRSSKK